MKLLVLNDTRAELHYGCDLVMQAILSKLNCKGENEVVTLPNTAGVDEIRREFVDGKPDKVIVNGEGTLHHDQPRAILLADAIYTAVELSIDVYIINSTVQENGTYIMNSLRLAKNIFVRDSRSKEYLGSLGIHSEIVADLSLYSRLGSAADDFNKENLLFSDSVNKNITDNLFNKYNKNGKFISLHHIPNGGRSRIAYKLYRKIVWLNSKIKFLLGISNNRDKMLLGYKNNLNDLICEISRAKIVVTGRFHLACLCILLRVPFVAIESNTYKISSLLKDVGLSDKRCVENVDDLHDFENLTTYSEYELSNIKYFMAEYTSSVEKMFHKILKNA